MTKPRGMLWIMSGERSGKGFATLIRDRVLKFHFKARAPGLDREKRRPGLKVRSAAERGS